MRNSVVQSFLSWDFQKRKNRYKLKIITLENTRRHGNLVPGICCALDYADIIFPIVATANP
jgi:hypothetical protein